MKDKLIKSAKIAMLLLPLIILFTNKKFNPHEIAENFRSVPLWIIPTSFFLLFLRIALQSLRFSVLTKAYTDKLHFWKLFHTDMKAKYYSIAIPSSVGQDIVRGTLIKEHISPDKIFGISIIFRLTGILPMILLSLTGLSSSSISHELGIPLWSIYVSFISFILFSAALFSERLSSLFFDRLLRFLPEKIHTFGLQCIASIHEYKQERKLLALNLFISLLTQFLIVFFFSTVLKSITGHFFLVESFFIFPIVEIIAILFPFSFNGAGAREVQYIVLLPSLITITPSEIPVFMSLCSIMYIINILGIFFVLIEKIIQKRSGNSNDKQLSK